MKPHISSVSTMFKFFGARQLDLFGPVISTVYGRRRMVRDLYDASEQSSHNVETRLAFVHIVNQAEDMNERKHLINIMRISRTTYYRWMRDKEALDNPTSQPALATYIRRK